MIESKRFWYKKNALKYAYEMQDKGYEASIWKKYLFRAWTVEVYEKWVGTVAWDTYEFKTGACDMQERYWDGLTISSKADAGPGRV